MDYVRITKYDTRAKNFTCTANLFVLQCNTKLQNETENCQVNKPRSISLRMEERIYETINTLARNEHRTFSNAVHMILELGLERYRDIKKQEKSL